MEVSVDGGTVLEGSVVGADVDDAGTVVSAALVVLDVSVVPQATAATHSAASSGPRAVRRTARRAGPSVDSPVSDLA
ncbi:MAG: hypothetical protein ACKOAZ_06750, partial [Ilumatobacteraceae bacterium]